MEPPVVRRDEPGSQDLERLHAQRRPKQYAALMPDGSQRTVDGDFTAHSAEGSTFTVLVEPRLPRRPGKKFKPADIAKMRALFENVHSPSKRRRGRYNFDDVNRKVFARKIATEAMETLPPTWPRSCPWAPGTISR